MICVDANILIAVLSPADRFYDLARRALVAAESAHVLNVNRAEALIHPHRRGEAETARRILGEFGVETHEVSDDIADRALRLRADHGNRNFPMLDALVVALGVDLDLEVVTTDDKWPTIPEARVRVLSTGD